MLIHYAYKGLSGAESFHVQYWLLSPFTEQKVVKWLASGFRLKLTMLRNIQQNGGQELGC